MSMLTERTPVIPDLNLRFGLLLLGLLAAILVAAQTDIDPRLLSTLAGAGALGGLTYRLISTWSETPVLVHVLALALIGLLLNGVIGQLQLNGVGPGALPQPAPLTSSVWTGIALRVACIVIAVFWPKWIDRRHSPFRRTPSR